MIKQQYVLFVTWLIVVVTYLLGISLPIATVEKFIFFDNEFSLVGSIVDLAAEGNGQSIFLLCIIVVFTFVFPVAKMVTMLLQIKNYHRNWQNRMTRFVEAVGHFSMLDVFVIALMVLLLKLRLLVNVSLHQGFYWFTFSIVLSIVLSLTIKKLRKKMECSTSECFDEMNKN